MLNGVAGAVTELSLKHCTLARHFDYTGGGRKFPETRASHIPQCCRAALQMGIHFHGGDHGTEMPGSKLGDVVGSTRHG